MKTELDPQLVTVQSLLFSDDIRQKGHRVVNREIFECAMRAGFSHMSRREDLEELAAEGSRLLSDGVDEAFVDWLDASDHFESACRLFAVYAAQNGEDPVMMAVALAGFYRAHSASDPATPEPIRRYIQENYRSAADELEKFSGFVARDLAVHPVSTGLQ